MRERPPRRRGERSPAVLGVAAGDDSKSIRRQPLGHFPAVGNSTLAVFPRTTTRAVSARFSSGGGCRPRMAAIRAIPAIRPRRPHKRSLAPCLRLFSTPPAPRRRVRPGGRHCRFRPARRRSRPTPAICRPLPGNAGRRDIPAHPEAFGGRSSPKVRRTSASS